MGIGAVTITRLRPSHDRAKFLLEVGQYLCLLFAFVCLGNVVLDYARARIFQAYQSWRFDRAIEHKPPSQMSMLMGWIDHELSAFMNEPVASFNQDRFQPHAPALAGGGSVPAVRSLPTGSLVGRMEIPRIGISVMVLEGDGDGVLEKAVGHVPTTAFPGGPGNVVIAGHRDTFFRALRKIRKDDDIIFTTTQGTYNYQVGSIEEVGPQDVQVLKASLHPTLTLVTCYPFDYIGSAPERFVVQAWETQSSRIGEPDQRLASARLTLDSHSEVRSTSSIRRKKSHTSSSRSASDSPPTRLATTLTGSVTAKDGPESTSDISPTRTGTTLTRSTRVLDGSESTQEAAEAQQVDPPAESRPASHKRFEKVRSWLGSIPRRLRQN
jgi:LPXTG-site transpeptidase (sortase) family protein